MTGQGQREGQEQCKGKDPRQGQGRVLDMGTDMDIYEIQTVDFGYRTFRHRVSPISELT